MERRQWEAWAVPFAASAREASLGLVHQDMNLLFAGRHPWKINRLPYFFGY